MYFSDDPEVDLIIEKCAERVERKFPDVIEAADLAQEGRLLVATHEDYKDRNLDYGVIYSRMYRDLLDIAKVEALKSDRQVSMQPDDEYDDADLYEGPAEPTEIPDGPYNRELVEFLLPGVWDQSYLFSLPRLERAPDPDMPRGSSNKARANNLPTYIADIKTGWRETRLTLKERRAVFLRYGACMSDREIAEHEQCSRPTVTIRVNGAIGKIVNRLNGGKDYYASVD